MSVNSCFCFNLRTGSLVIVWLRVILTILALISNLNDIVAVWLLILFFTSVSALYATYKEQEQFLWPFIISIFVSIILLAILFIYNIVNYYQTVNSIDTIQFCYYKLGILHKSSNFYNITHTLYRMPIIQMLLLIALRLKVYFLGVIVSFYRQIKEENLAKLQSKQHSQIERGVLLYPSF